MTGTGIIQAFLVYYDRVTSFAAPGYTTEEILLFLNNAQDEFVKDRTFGKNFQPPAFEDNQRRVADISPLVKTELVSTISDPTPVYGPTSYRVLKSSFGSGRVLWFIDVEGNVFRDGYPEISGGEWIKCIPIKNENAANFISSKVNKTHFINPKWLQDELNVWVIGDSHLADIDELRATYIRRPYPITESILEYDGSYDATHMNLMPEVHQEIIDIAVRQALQVLQDPRWQTKVSEQQIKSE